MKKRYPFLLKNLLQQGCLTLIAISFSISLQAQTTPYKLWDKTFGGCGTDNLRSVEQTADGGYILGGSSVSNITGDKSENIKGGTIWSDYWIVKMDASGNKVWDKTIGGNEVDELTAMQQTSDGGYILGGWTGSEQSSDKSEPSRGIHDFWVVKLDANGNKVWDKTFGGYYTDYLYSLQQTADGGYILGGMSTSYISGDKTASSIGSSGDYWVIKLDANGNKLWDNTFGSYSIEYLSVVKQASDGGYILGGWTSGGNGSVKGNSFKGGKDYWVIKLNANGSMAWNKIYGGTTDDELKALELTSDGGYILGGSSRSGASGDKSQPAKGNSDYWVVKIDSRGNKEWDKSFGGSGSDDLTAIQQTFDGRFILGGSSDSGLGTDKSESCRGKSDFWIIQVDESGNKLWDKTIGGNMEDQLTSLKQTSDGNFILGGSSDGGLGFDRSQPGQGFGDYWVVKLASPYTTLTTKLQTICNGNASTVNVNIIGIPPAKAGTLSWTLNYTENGVSKNVTGTTSTYTLAENVTPGTIFSLTSITSGTFVINLSNTLTVQERPNAPVVTNGSKCNYGNISLSAKGAQPNGYYVWYTEPFGGTPVYKSQLGVFETLGLTSSATFYVAIANNGGCEGPRASAAAIIGNCDSPVFPNLITPNNDGVGDTFVPLLLPDGRWEIQVFNRTGAKVFESGIYRNNWPNTNVSAGVYYFILTNSVTGKSFKGSLVVIQ